MGAASLASKSSSNSDKGEDNLDRRERCDDLEDAPPSIIELRTPDASQLPQWRELRIDDSTGEPRWGPTDESGDASSWRPAENLLKMNFQPPLNLLLNSRSSSFLIYAPAEPQTAEEANQLDGLVAEFGSGAGTFHWHTRIYQYALVTKLPCFPLSTAMR